MLVIKEKLKQTIAYPLYEPYDKKEILFFDIETTGFSSKTSYLYLIGCVYYEENSWFLMQWLLEDPNKESKLLQAFSKKIKPYKRIIHYNGDRFDIPFLIDKYKKFHLEIPFGNKDSLDLYKQVFPYKKLFPLPNMKLQTISSYLDFHRSDQYTGGELINVYAQFIGHLQYEKLIIDTKKDNQKGPYHQNSTASSLDLANTLLVHNKEDVLSLLEISKMLFYVDFLKFNFTKEQISDKHEIYDNICTMIIQTPITVPHEIKWHLPLWGNNKLTKSPDKVEGIKIKLWENNIYIRVPLYIGSLKYFYKDYKEYYYLPKEDMAIHKSVAEYVDRKYRNKAKPSTCYNHKTGTFIPVTPAFSLEEGSIPIFKEDYRSKVQYIEIDNIIKDKMNLIKWCQSLLDFTINNHV